MSTRKRAAKAAPPPPPPLPSNPIPRFRPGEVIVKFLDAAMVTRLPITPAQIARTARMAEFLKLLAQLDKQYDLVSVQPLIRDGHPLLDTILPGLSGLLLRGSLSGFRNRVAGLLEQGRSLSFPQDFRETAVAVAAPLSGKRLKEALSRLLLRFRKASAADLDQIVTRLRSLGAVVEYAEKVPLRYAPVVASSSEPLSDPQPPLPWPVKLRAPYGEQWGFEATNWPGKAAGFLTPERPSSRKVAMVDTGVDLNHPLLQDGRVESGFSNWIWDRQGHGTHVCGILNAATGYHPDIPVPVIQGMLPPGSKVVSYKVVENTLSSWGFYPVNPVFYASALEDIAARGGFDAVNISMGGEAPLSQTEQDWIGKIDAQCPVIAAAGNHPNAGDYDGVLYPAAADPVIAVGAAVDRPGWTPQVDVWKHSNTGLTQDDYIAPGFNIYSTMPTYPPPDYPNRDYVQHRAWMPGTSMAAPFITALMALFGRNLAGLSVAVPAEPVTQTSSSPRDTSACGKGIPVL